MHYLEKFVNCSQRAQSINDVSCVSPLKKNANNTELGRLSFIDTNGLCPPWAPMFISSERPCNSLETWKENLSREG